MIPPYAFVNREKHDSISGLPSIDNLRRKTRSPVSSPRTSTPRAIAITSVADQLESHYTSLRAVVSEMIPTQQAASQVNILKPVAELSRLALDRHQLKKDNLVRPVTELARLGMDRWLNSTVMTKRKRVNEIGAGTVAHDTTVDFDVAGGI
jgi:hypothetical protein